IMGTGKEDISKERENMALQTENMSEKNKDITSVKKEMLKENKDIAEKMEGSKGNKDYPLKEFYQKIYGRYDLVNRIFTFGQDRYWRKKAVEECLGNAPRQVLDICTGTGDLVMEMAQTDGQTRDSTIKNSVNEVEQVADLSAIGPAEKSPSSAATTTSVHFTGYDFSAEMLEKAREKTAAAGASIDFIEGNVAEMPFDDNRFDTAGITFGIRNLVYENSNAEKHLAEIHRVLRMNGRLVVLESSKPDSRVWRFFNGIYLQLILPWLGGLISGNLKAYRYLAKSSQNYYSRKEMAAILEQAGFRVIRSRPLFLGSVMLLVAEKQ
ncbi:MAG: class I SAM-dependent methyltransferase, partial [Bacteroidales bacterium]|nr:class I SAM-dependent methyltransferase [Bacteroidales bacterium]